MTDFTYDDWLYLWWLTLLMMTDFTYDDW
jgi:hypothetical protein